MATNKRFDGWKYPVVCSNPATPASGDPVRYGEMTGVALNDEGDGGNAATETSVDFGPAVWSLSVKAVNDSGNSAVAKGDMIFYVDADTPKLSKKSSGYLFGVAMEAINSGSTATIQVLKLPSPGSGTLGSGTVGTTNLAAGAVTAAKIGDGEVGAAALTTTLATGFIPLDITTARIISTNAIQNTTEAGVPDGNTSPSLARVNGATDKSLRLAWAAAGVEEIQFAPIPKPPDLDDAEDVIVHLMLAKDANTDNAAVVGVSFWDGVGDSNAGGNTGALDSATLAEYTVTVAAANIAAAPGFFNVSITPGTHANDAVYLYAAWLEYTRV